MDTRFEMFSLVTIFDLFLVLIARVGFLSRIRTTAMFGRKKINQTLTLMKRTRSKLVEEICLNKSPIAE